MRCLRYLRSENWELKFKREVEVEEIDLRMIIIEIIIKVTGVFEIYGKKRIEKGKRKLIGEI